MEGKKGGEKELIKAWAEAAFFFLTETLGHKLAQAARHRSVGEGQRRLHLPCPSSLCPAND